jgi:hypothetical protein
MLTLLVACGTSEKETRPNGAAAINALQTIAVSQSLYNKQHARLAYGTFDQLIADTALDKSFAGDAPVIGGYIYKLTVVPRAGGRPQFFSVNADPKTPGGSHYYLDSNSNTVTVNDQKPAAPDDPPAAQP